MWSPSSGKKGSNYIPISINQTHSERQTEAHSPFSSPISPTAALPLLSVSLLYLPLPPTNSTPILAPWFPYLLPNMLLKNSLPGCDLVRQVCHSFCPFSRKMQQIDGQNYYSIWAFEHHVKKQRFKTPERI